MGTTTLNWELKPWPGRQIVWFNIRDFLAQVEKPWVIDPYDLNYRQIDKIAKVKEYFESGGPMDPSDVQGLVCDVKSRGTPDDKRIVLEGRHRLVAALELGETHAPFAVPIDIVDYLYSII